MNPHLLSKLGELVNVAGLQAHIELFYPWGEGLRLQRTIPKSAIEANQERIVAGRTRFFGRSNAGFKSQDIFRAPWPKRRGRAHHFYGSKPMSDPAFRPRLLGYGHARAIPPPHPCQKKRGL